MNPPSATSRNNDVPILVNRLLKKEDVNWRELQWLQAEDAKEQIDIEKLIQSIVKNGLIRGFQVWEDDKGVRWILDGHHLNRALQTIEDRDLLIIPELLPAHFIECESKKEAAKLVVIFSASYARFTSTGLMAHLVTYDIEVEDVVPVVNLEAFDVSQVEALAHQAGQEHEEVRTADAQEDDMSNSRMPKFAITELGDLYELKSIAKGLSHRVQCGDSTEYDTVESLMNGEIGELLFTSPPYADMREYEGGKDLSIEYLIEFIPSFLPFANYLAINLGLKREKHELVSYWDDYIQKAQDCGYKFLSWNIWNKGEAGSISYQKAIFSIIHEWILVFGKEVKELNKTLKCKTAGEGNWGQGTLRDKKGKLNKVKKKATTETKQLETVINIQPYKSQKQFSSKQPAMFPVELPFEYIIAMTNKGDIVIEPFSGSGTTLMACEQSGRHCYCQDLEPAYVDLAIARYAKYMRERGDEFEIWRNGERLLSIDVDKYIASAFYEEQIDEDDSE